MTTLSPAAERLLLTASRLFCQDGIRSVGIDRIIAEADVAKATLYQAFGSKEGLIVAHLERRDDDDRAAYLAAVADLPEGVERLFASFDLAARRTAADDFIGCVYLNALNEFPEPDGAIATAVRRHRDWVRARWIEALGGRPDAERIADEAQLVYDGALLGAKVVHSAAPVGLAGEVVRARVLG